MTRKKPNIGPLIEALKRHDMTTMDCAEELYVYVEVLALERGNGHGVPLTVLINDVREQIGEAGFDQSNGRLIKWYRTAAWVAANNDGAMKWVEGRHFSHHLRAFQRPSWTWEMLLEHAPPKKAQGVKPGMQWMVAWHEAVTKLRHSRELIGVDARYVSGSRSKMLATIGDDTDRALEILDNASGTINRL